MKCLEFPPKSFDDCNFSFPSDMKKLVDFLEADKIKINCDLMTLEKLWFAFSETWDAHFLGVSNDDENDTYPRFLKWVRDIDVDTADHMDYYGTVTNSVHRPWDNDDREDDE